VEQAEKLRVYQTGLEFIRKQCLLSKRCNRQTLEKSAAGVKLRFQCKTQTQIHRSVVFKKPAKRYRLSTLQPSKLQPIFRWSDRISCLPKIKGTKWWQDKILNRISRELFFIFENRGFFEKSKFSGYRL
jgi:hypothetical protein